MSRKNKLQRFSENETFNCLIQPSTEEVFRTDYRTKGKWNSDIFHNGNPIVLELGCGKGEYTIALSRKYPDRNFIGVDIKGARLWKGAKEASQCNLPNVAFLRTRIEFIESCFEKGEVSEIWITFADPQPKNSRKRLTHPMFLDRYKKFLKDDGLIHLKTDSLLLHEFSLEVLPQNGFDMLVHNNDIYGEGHGMDLGCGLGENDHIRSVKTFYEQQFLAKGMPITYLCCRRNGQ